MTVENDLTIAAARVARMAPNHWNELMAALAAYSNQQTQNCIQSPLEQLPVAQGRAQATARLFGFMTDCLRSADKLEERKK
jgi:hypothetical protein